MSRTLQLYGVQFSNCSPAEYNGSVIKTKSNLERGVGKSLDLQIFSLVDYFKKTNTFLVCAICFHDTVHNKWCFHKSVQQTENGLEQGFVKH